MSKKESKSNIGAVLGISFIVATLFVGGFVTLMMAAYNPSFQKVEGENWPLTAALDGMIVATIVWAIITIVETARIAIKNNKQ